jgi:DNA-binding CsgD family transcriptional regulator
MLYRAAVEPAMWRPALQRFAESVGCIGMAMIRITPNDKEGLIVSPSLDESNVDYQKEWWQQDTRVGRIFARQLSRGVCCEAQLFSDEELARDSLRQGFCRKWGIGAFAAQLIDPWPGRVVAFSAQRALKKGHFEGYELEALRRIGQHAARALTIAVRLSASENTTGSLLDILERFDGAVFVLNARREVVMTSASAEKMLGDGLTVAGRRLIASAGAQQRALDALITSALDRGVAAVEALPVSLSRPSGKKPLLVQAMPLRSQRLIEESGESAFAPDGAMLLVVDPELGPAAPHETLRLLGLTAAEAKLAALVGAGMRRREAAAALGISEWTARDALKRVYSKLEIGSLGELVRLVDRIAAVERRKHSPN